MQEADVCIIGGGHAGTEACAAAARAGAKTILVTQKLEAIGEMSCNPSFGGIGKGTLVKEIDALDGLCGLICDKAGIQFRMLNASRGPAVWGPRAQIDRKLYKKYMQAELATYPNLKIYQGLVVDILTNSDCNGKLVTGIKLETGEIIATKKIVITTGIFLDERFILSLKHIPLEGWGKKHQQV